MNCDNGIEPDDDIREDICEVCADNADGPINTNQFNMCEGSSCDQAYVWYLESKEEELAEKEIPKKLERFLRVNGVWESFTKNVEDLKDVGYTNKRGLSWFVWGASLEGHKFWNELHSKYMEIKDEL